MSKSVLTTTQLDRIRRFTELSAKKGITVELNGAQTKVELKNKAGRVIASRPVSDFAD